MQKPAPVLTRYGLARYGWARYGWACSGLMLILALAGCAGPQLHINNPDDHQVFLDGRRTNAESLPFRYYGTSRWATLPQIPEVNGVPTFDRSPHTESIAIVAPSSPWLFPLDFPLEVMHWLFVGQSDQTVTVTAPSKPPKQRIGQQIAGEKLSQLSARARQARIAR